MLEEMGHCVSGEAGQIDQALSMARSAEFDLAILDVNMAGRIVTPVAEIMHCETGPSFSRQVTPLKRSPSRSETVQRSASHSCSKTCSRL